MNHMSNYLNYAEVSVLKDLEIAETQFEALARQETVTPEERKQFQDSINGARNVIRNRAKKRMPGVSV